MKKKLCGLLVAGLSLCLAGGEVSLLEQETVSDIRLHELSVPGSSLTYRDLPGGRTGVTLSVEKRCQERVFLALAIPFSGGYEVFRSVSADAFLKCDSGLTCRWLLLVEDGVGRRWRRVGSLLAPGENLDLQCQLQGGLLRPLDGFGKGLSAPDWMTVRRLGIGLAVDGRGKGAVTFGRIVLRDAGYRATASKRLPLGKVSQWRLNADPAVTDVTLEDGHGQTSGLWRLGFCFPTRKHLYVLAERSLPEMDYQAYSGLRLVFRAQLPSPLSSVLVLVATPEGHYGGEVSVTRGWQTCELSFEAMKGVSWEPAVRGQKLVREAIKALTIGCHGTAASGTKADIQVKSFELIP